ncbi:MAG: type II toxin-antitoxin system VapC family toxin [Acidobacteriota bacterium]
MGNNHIPVIYWDSSAVLSVLFEDGYSADAINWSRQQGIHLVSSLVYAEVCAVISRFKRERILADILLAAAYEAIEKGSWRQIHVHPDWSLMKKTASKRSLRGADLWHLCEVLSLREPLPEIRLLTFDERLKKAAKAENLIF